MISTVMIAQIITIVLPLLLSVAVGVVLLRRRMGALAISSAAPRIAVDGTIAVQVRGLYLRRAGIFGGDSKNSINPRFAIGPDGIWYRVFRSGRLPFSTIDHVEVRERFGSVYLLLLIKTGPLLLSVNVGDRATAKRVLTTLPHTVPLTPEAATIRDGVAGVGTIGLRLYHGPFA